ncbi:MAG: NADH-quinone oxidoreductase subunit A [Actinobacteria bacterium]|nr:NADH-quinone oxidoreductase subunit A [Actinomycetota bacterium]
MSEEAVYFIAGLALAAALFILAVFALSSILSPRRPNPEKNAPYECGMPQAGSAWNQIDLRFSSLAVLFVLFEAFAILLFATLVALRGSLDNLIPGAALLGMLCLALLYAWRKGGLQWRL